MLDNLDTELLKLSAGKGWFSSDSRSLLSGDVYVALKGKTQDGHKFIGDVVKKVPALVVAHMDFMDAAKSVVPKHIPICFVDDTSEAHVRIASFFRKRFSGPVIGIGGSNGKTTTKDFLGFLLKDKFRCAVTERSQNGRKGLPKTLEKLRPGTDIGVIEIGIDAPGDMANHCAMVLPTIGILTSVGEEHLHQLKDISTVLKEESVLAHSVFKKNGVVLIPKEDLLLAPLVQAGARQVDSSPLKNLRPDIINPFILRSMALAIAAARYLGISPEEINQAVLKFRLPPGRGNLYQLEPSFFLIADQYNANPTSMEASLSAASAYAKYMGLNLHLILGDMADLGPQSSEYHRQLERSFDRLAPSSIHLIGPYMSHLRKTPTDHSRFLYPSTNDACKHVDKIFSKPGLYLIKGSRINALERLLHLAASSRQWNLDYELTL